MYYEYQPRESRSHQLSIQTVVIIAIIAVAGLVGNLYIYSLFSERVQDLENRTAALQTQIFALTEVLKNYSQIRLGNTSLSELYDNVKDSVVLIRGEKVDGWVAGSGFVYYCNVSDQMIVVTNYHVVRDANVYVTFRNGHAFSARLLGFDVYADLAVLSVDNAPPEEFRPLPIVPSSMLAVGDLVIAIGNPYELVGSMTTGIVSQLGRAVPEELAGGYSIANVIQISAPINPGNSGGPLLNSKGQVVGVTFAIISNSTGVGFAIPSDTVLREISWLVNGLTFPHSWIGVMGMDMNFQIAQEIGTSTTYGWVIVDVISNSPAANAGLQQDDIILAMNDTQIVNGDALSSYLEDYTSPGQLVAITVERDGDEITVPLVLGVRPQP